jgi:hypothetical protein
MDLCVFIKLKGRGGSGRFKAYKYCEKINKILLTSPPGAFKIVCSIS